ncbi:MAG TPA: sensor domain-containing diguanylate cyclase [Terriglobales bacterium]|nr:sensor domain-containing diguanylate cyclase [Terriglobales bacterium]
MSQKYSRLGDPKVLQDFVDRIAEGVYITSLEGEILDANPGFVQMLGFKTLEELRKYKATDLVDPELRARQIEILKRVGSVRDFELQIRRPDGEIRTVLDTAFSAVDSSTGQTVFRGIVHDITIRKRLEYQLQEQSIRDPLTGSFNRRYLKEFEERAGEETWGCVVIDIDHFKQYNDSRGHQAGDQVLVKLSRFLMRHLRSQEAVVRMGGDEFLILLPGSDLARTTHTAKRIEDAAAKEAPAPFSMGFAARESKEMLEKTINRADENLYEVRTYYRAPNQERRKLH